MPTLPRFWCVLAVVCLFAAASSAQQISHPLITQPIDETQLTTLRGNTHPLAQPQFDVGAAPPNLPLNRMLLVLNHSLQQDFALHKLLDDQQDKASPNYHKWLTPDEFGTQFGPSDQDVQLVTGWLQTHGFQVNRVSHGRSVIEFSGVEAQVEQAFHTHIHQYSVNGQLHWANASDPQIPAALAPAVAGVLSLYNFPRHSMTNRIGTYSPVTKQLSPKNPLFTLIGWGCDQNGNCYAVGPADFGTIYNAQGLWKSGIDGTGQTIAIVGETDINPQDVDDFRNLFGLPPKKLNIIVDGPDPGFQGDEGEADIDVQWSGAVAPNATVDFVISESTETTAGIDLSAIYIIDNNLAPVMSESYGFCELGLGTSGNQFYNSLWAQGAAQGMTVILAAGDSGAAGCDQNSGLPAQFGLTVSGFASTPFNVAIGGTDFNDVLNPQQYWNSSNTAATQESAKGYIPETTWNLSCTNSILLGDFGWGTNAENNCNNAQLFSQAQFLWQAVGGSGGASNCTTSTGQNPSTCSGGYSKPSWQVAPGVPQDGKRDLPDVSLFASNGVMGNFYIFCQADSQALCSAGQYGAAGGTSFGAPAFAGIMSLVNQQMQNQQLPGRQGNPNYVLYKLAGQQTASSCNSATGPAASCVFNDITSGTIAMPCFAGSPNCVVQTAGHQYGVLSGYSTGTGYDLATGLGSINVANLVNKWSSVVFRATNTSLTLNPTINVTHGQNVTVTADVTPGSGSGTPTGGLSLLTSTGVSAGTFTLGANGTLSTTTNLLPGGSYTVSAHYAGDSTFGGSDSSPVNVTVGKENSSPSIELVTFDWQGNETNANANTAVYGSPFLLRVDVLNSAGNPCQTNNVQQSGCPTGNVNLTDNGNPLDAGTYALNSLGYTEDQTVPVQFSGGSNAVKAQYAGDNSFNSSSTTKTYNITPAPTTTNGYFYCTCAVGSNYNAYAIVQAQSSGATPTGTFTFYANGKAFPGNIMYSPIPASGYPPTIAYQANINSSTSPFPTPGNYTLTASYNGDANYQPSTSSGTTFYVKFPIPTVNLQASPNPVNAGSATTLAATVLGGSPTIAPTGTISFYEPIVGLTPLPGTVSYTTVTDPSTGNLDLKGTLTVQPGFTAGYFSNYNGDANYPAGSTCCATFVTVNGNDFVLSAQQSSASVFAGASAYYQLMVGLQSNTGPVSFGANACSGLPAEATCSVSPDPTSSTGFVNLQISTTGPHGVPGVRPSSYRSQLFWAAGSTLPFAAILLIGYRRGGNKHLPTRLLLTVIIVLDAGCGGGGTGGGGGGGGGGTLSAPTNLMATAASYNEIDLNWIQPAGTGFTIYRSTTSGFTPSPSNQIASYPSGYAFSYPDSSLAPSTTYYYVVKATNSSGASGPSNQASATTQALDPGTPAGTYNITVTGTSGSGASAITHSTTVTLVVQ